MSAFDGGGEVVRSGGSEPGKGRGIGRSVEAGFSRKSLPSEGQPVSRAG